MTPLILFYNRPWPDMPYADIDLSGCPGAATFTTDLHDIWRADAVIFHLPNLYSMPLFRHQVWHRLKRQRWVLWSMESILYYPRQGDRRWLNLFDLTMTYRRDADVWYPYLGDVRIEPMLRPAPPKSETALASYFASNANALSGRDAYVTELMRHIPIDSFGRVMRNRTLETDIGMVTKNDVMPRYKFHLAFENSITEDYVTEKFFHPFMVGTLPVYLGAPNVEDYAPADHCYINAADYTPSQLAEYLRYLDGDDDAYNAYFAWKTPDKIRPAFRALLEQYQPGPFCKLAALI